MNKRPPEKIQKIFIEMLNRHLNNDKTILPADDPVKNKFGFVFTNSVVFPDLNDGKEKHVTLEEMFFRNNYPNEFEKLMVKRGML